MVSQEYGIYGLPKKNSAFSFKTPVGIVNDALAHSKANFIKIRHAVNACRIGVALYLEPIKALLF